MNDPVADTLAMGCGRTTRKAEQVRGHMIGGSAISTAAHAASLPALPSTAETGLPETQMSGCNMLFALAGTLSAIGERDAPCCRRSTM